MKKLLSILFLLSSPALAIDKPIPCTGNSCKLLFETTGSGGAKVSAGNVDGLGKWTIGPSGYTGTHAVNGVASLFGMATPPQVITSGSSATINTGVSAVILTGISGAFTLTFPTPGNLVDGQIIIISNQSAATLTYGANGSTFTGGSGSAPGTNASQILMFRTSNSSWYLVARGT